jgi:hypothetical protein
MPCGKRTRNFNHSGQLEKFVTLGNCNAPVHQLTKKAKQKRKLVTRPGFDKYLG